MRALLLFAIVPLLALPLPAHASLSYCYGNVPALGLVEISPTNDARATIYVDDRNYVLGSGIWIYQESNGVFHDPVYHDLQRGGSSIVIPDDNEFCTDPSPNGPDTLIY